MRQRNVPVLPIPELADILSAGDPFLLPKSVSSTGQRLALSIISAVYNKAEEMIGTAPELLFVSEDIVSCLYGISIDDLRNLEEDRRGQLDGQEQEVQDTLQEEVERVYNVVLAPVAGLLLFRNARILVASDIGDCRCLYLVPS